MNPPYSTGIGCANGSCWLSIIKRGGAILNVTTVGTESPPGENRGLCSRFRVSDSYCTNPATSRMPAPLGNRVRRLS